MFFFFTIISSVMFIVSLSGHPPLHITIIIRSNVVAQHLALQLWPRPDSLSHAQSSVSLCLALKRCCVKQQCSVVVLFPFFSYYPWLAYDTLAVAAWTLIAHRLH